MARNPTLDRQALYLAADDLRDARGLSWRDVALEVGISASTFSKLAQGKAPDADNLLRIVVWLDTDLRLYELETPTEPVSDDLLAELSPSELVGAAG